MTAPTLMSRCLLQAATFLTLVSMWSWATWEAMPSTWAQNSRPASVDLFFTTAMDPHRDAEPVDLLGVLVILIDQVPQNAGGDDLITRAAKGRLRDSRPGFLQQGSVH